MDLDLDDWIVCWTPTHAWTGEHKYLEPGTILVDRLGSDSYWNDKFLFTGGFCYTDRHRMNLEQQIMMMFIDFHTCVVRDGIDPMAAHREFLKIGEYRRRISPDIKGAE
jgi:hypothetical protein